MELWTFIIAAGVLGVILFSYVLGGWRTARIESAAHAAALLRESEPDFTPAEALLGTGGGAALLSEQDGERLGVVVVQGDRFAVRIAAPGEVKAARLAKSRDGSASLEIALDDIGFPKVRLALPGNDEGREWLARLKTMARERHGSC